LRPYFFPKWLGVRARRSALMRRHTPRPSPVASAVRAPKSGSRHEPHVSTRDRFAKGSIASHSRGNNRRRPGVYCLRLRLRPQRWSMGHFDMSVATVMARVRLCGGMVLMLYVVCHLSNLSLGLWSLQLMERWRLVIMVPWQSRVGQFLLYGALASHVVLGLVSLSDRRRAASTRSADIAQLALGLFIPPLLVLHLLASRGAALLDGFQPSYGWFMFVYWKQAPLNGLRQVLVVSAAWIHGCLGLHTWLRLRPWWPKAAGFVYPLVFLVPILALLGFVEAGKEALALMNGGDPVWAEGITAAAARFAAISPKLLLIQDIFLGAYAAAVASAITAFIVRSRRRRRATALIEYVEGPTVRASLGLSILEVSRTNDLPHASACAGHARCATCRVRVVAGMHNLSPPLLLETELLNRIGLEADVRLACQALLIGPSVTVQRLIPADEEEAAARDPLGWTVRSTPASAVAGAG
jgi:adenylate cyclase